jgi:4'-phosphopantetheinyl transferase
MLTGNDVHVWRIQLPRDGELSDGFTSCLSSEEAARAARFIFERDRASYTVAHTALRQILARYIDQAPSEIAIHATENGKPYSADYPEIRFNLSHSGAWALVAVARGRELGVDIEHMRRKRASEGIAERFFAPAEVRELMEMTPERRAASFFACWSRKEAYIKARGEGLRIPLESFEVSLGEEAILRKAADRERWSMCALDAPEDYAAALVVEGSRCRVTQLEWTFHPEI